MLLFANEWGPRPNEFCRAGLDEFAVELSGKGPQELLSLDPYVVELLEICRAQWSNWGVTVMGVAAWPRDTAPLFSK